MIIVNDKNEIASEQAHSTEEQIELSNDQRVNITEALLGGKSRVDFIMDCHPSGLASKVTIRSLGDGLSVEENVTRPIGGNGDQEITDQFKLSSVGELETGVRTTIVSHDDISGRSESLLLSQDIDMLLARLVD